MQNRPGIIACVATAAMLLHAPRQAFAQAAAFRGVWVSSRDSFRTAGEVNATIARVVQGNYNAILPHVWSLQDAPNGVYWHSNILPRSTWASEDFDPLAYLVEQAHAHGIEVHPWIAPYRSCREWPPVGNGILTLHPEWIMTSRAEMGNGPSKLDGNYYYLDPGSSDVQEYLISIVRELVTNYAIDGIHWDIIRYTEVDAGYPSNLAYAQSGLARFQRIENYPGVPPPQLEPRWDQFRRREISELVRRSYAEIAAVTSNPRQPLRHTAALAAWGLPREDFTESSAYKSVFQDWRGWMAQGWLDAACPMTYREEYIETEAQYYRDWIAMTLGWRYGRHAFFGQGMFINTMADSVTQLQYALDQGADGTVSFSHYSTVDSDQDGVSENDWTWYEYVSANCFTAPVPIPSMPWRDPTTATEATLWGRVIDADGNPVDNLLVGFPHGSTVRTDGNGYYVHTRIRAVPGGSTYTAVAQYPFIGSRSTTAIFEPGGVTRVDFWSGDGPLVRLSATPTTVVRHQPVSFMPTVTCYDSTSSVSHVWQFGAETTPASGAPAEISRRFKLAGDIHCSLSVTDTAAETAESNHVIVQVIASPVTIGDADNDGDVDLTDFSAFRQCFNGPNRAYASDGNCAAADADDDNDVDLTDFIAFQYCFNGPNRPPAHGTDCF
ncbi:MAG: family 10 glycosylhydrolase [Phycisphaerae bacterium]|nr:family 10 glycosylhydrolase [Phycisphaerae bacterium]